MNFKNGFVAAGHTETARAAEMILQDGGNAVDAAIAALFAACIAEPCMSSLGGGGFAIIGSTPKNALSYDFFCQSPSKKLQKSQFYPVEVDFGSFKENFYIGAGSMATPGTVSGIFKMHQDHGTMGLKDLVVPALEIARKGVEINAFQYYDFELLSGINIQSAVGRELFFNSDTLKQVGEVIYLEQMADVLETLAIEGSDLFYRGEIGKLILEQCNTQGGHLNTSDLAEYETLVTKPHHFEYHERAVFGPGTSSLGPLLIEDMLSHLHKIKPGTVPFSLEHIESLYNPLKHSGLLLEKLKKSNPLSSKGTTHLNVLDRKGMAVSLTISNGEGCGFFIPGTQIQMNNMLGELALLPDGFHSWVQGQRLSSLMSPTMLFHNGEPSLICGSGGASRIPSALALLIHYLKT